ncbi:ATP-binding cassette domain-containing protein, partial [Paenibacillus sepulcri]|nr:ATP-binding cassette domain-containing protein [Paenibacillus sepulcri]
MDRTDDDILEQWFIKNGEWIELEGNKPLIVTDETSLWLIMSGSADIFAVALQGGAVTRQPQFLFSLHAGRFIFGFHEDVAEASAGMLIAGLSGTQLIRMDMSLFLQANSDHSVHMAMADSIDEWVQDWSSALRRLNNATDFIELEAVSQLAAAEGAVFRSSNVLWIEMHAGKLHWMDDERFAVVQPGMTMPLSSVSWISAAEPSVISAYGTAEWLKKDAELRGLSEFHRLLYRCLLDNRRSEGKVEYDRLKRKTENDHAVMDLALNRLAAVTGASRKKAAAETGSTDLLYIACKIVGESLGMAVKPVAGKSLHKLRDPVGHVAKSSGFRSRQVMLKDDWWRSDNGPLLAYLEANKQPVALIQKNASTYILVDSADGTEQTITEDLARNIAPVAFMFYRPLPTKPLSVMDIIKFGSHKTIKRDLYIMVFMGIAGGLLGMLVPIANGILFDSIIPASEKGLLLQMGLILLSVILSMSLFELTRSMAMLRIEGKMGGSIQAAVWDRLLNLPVSFFRDYSSGDLALRANSINTIRQAVSGVALTAIFSGIFSSFNLLLLFYYNVKLALVATVLVLISMAVTLGVGILQVKRQRVLLAVQGKISTTVLQIINGISKFRMAAAEKRAFFLWAKQFGELKETAFQAKTLTNLHAVFNAFFPVITSMTLFYIMASGGGAMSPGKFIAFFSAFSAFLGAMIAMSTAVVSILSIVPQYERAKPILQTVPEVHEALEDPGELTGAIEVRHIRFRYRMDQPWILNDLSLQIRPGEFIALVGASGCGKSTLLRLLLGFEKPESGSLYFDGQDLKTLDVRSVRRQF